MIGRKFRGQGVGIYLSGVLLCIVINLFRMIIILSGYFSTKSQNFRKIKLYYDISTGGYSKKKPAWQTILFRFADLLLITPLLSWVAVVWIIIAYVRSYIDKVPLPEKIKEINFKLSSAGLSPDKVKECLSEIATFYGYPDAGFRTLTDSEDGDPNWFVFSPPEDETDWYSDMQLNPELKRYIIYTHSPDYDYQSYTTYEYKIENTDIYSRVIEEKSEHMGDPDAEYDIKDNVVLESDVRERMSKSMLFNSEKDIKEKIGELRRDVQWQKIENPRFKYFIMFRHGDAFKDDDIRKFFRAELERLKGGYTMLEQEVKKLGGFILPLEDERAKFGRIHWADGLPEEKVKMLQDLYDTSEKFKISHYELHNSDKITEELTSYLDKIN
ncbi:MAG: hypothetical protein M0018_02735 [Nitrospiraceae bacterium]|nr:hypothetical protein [Nitrospiraceae bacterium]